MMLNIDFNLFLKGDVLMNVNIADSERTKKNLLNKKLGTGAYKAYDDDEVDEFGHFKVKQILDKYDEELEGPKKESFRLERGKGVAHKDKKILFYLKVCSHSYVSKSSSCMRDI